MLVLEAKLKGRTEQFRVIDDIIRAAQFIQNKALRFWMDSSPEDKVNRYSLNKYCAVLAADPEYPWVKKLNSMARQASAERAWGAIARFFDNCKKKVLGKKGFPKFKKFCRSVEYKTTGWKLSKDRKSLTLTDGFDAGIFKLKGTRDLNFYDVKQIKRVRVVKRADGYYAQFCIDVERKERIKYTGSEIGIDVGLNHFLTDSTGKKVDNPRHLRSSEKRLKKLQRRMSNRYRNPNKGMKGQAMVKTKTPQSKRYHKARIQVALGHLEVTRRRKDFVVKTARALIQSNDLVAYEDLRVRNLVKNHNLAKSISDASWTMFREWLEYFAKVFDKVAVAVPPHYTSQNCSGCGAVVKKSLSVRTHACTCGTILDRDENAAINILMKAFEMLGKNTVGHTGIYAHGQPDLCVVGEILQRKSSGNPPPGKI
ncbi:MAG TPA: transposase [Cyanobacteria bacterium UBA8553]|nr:transposase [Cyanobacteria bacterium UBA8553]